MPPCGTNQHAEVWVSGDLVHVVSEGGETISELKRRICGRVGLDKLIPSLFDLQMPDGTPIVGKQKLSAGTHEFKMHIAGDIPCPHGKKCHWGAACRYSHTAQPGGSTEKPKICGHFQRGRCCYGTDCKFVHSQQLPALEAKPRKKCKTICVHYMEKLQNPFLRGCTFGDFCKYTHSDENGSTPSDPPVDQDDLIKLLNQVTEIYGIEKNSSIELNNGNTSPGLTNVSSEL